MRIDLFLVQTGLTSSRERAQMLISSGAVAVNGAVCPKNSFDVTETDSVSVTEDLKYVGRGALKLERALDVFGIDVSGKNVLDIGASTGGFTDCCLQRGACSSVAVDVGHGQLAPALVADPRVRNLEGVHVKDLREHYTETADFICVDVSFLSLTKVFPYLIPFCTTETDLVVLVKPQFEIRHKKSVIRDPKIHRTVLNDVLASAVSAGFSPMGLIPSPVRGTEGNIEFLLYLKYGVPARLPDVTAAVREAHTTKKGGVGK